MAATVDAVIAHGGELVQPIGADAPEITAWFRDAGGEAPSAAGLLDTSIFIASDSGRPLGDLPRMPSGLPW